MTFKIDDNAETVTCRICGEQVKRVYGRHLQGHSISSNEYKKQFPGAPLTTSLDQKNTSKNSGQHMKEEKYKTMFSEKFSGEKKSKTFFKSIKTGIKRRISILYRILQKEIS